MILRTQRHAHSPQDATTSTIDPEIRRALHDWRSHMGHGAQLDEPYDPAHDHVCGDREAPVVVVEYGELGSATESVEDRSVREKLRTLIDEGRICLAFRHFPIVDSHPGAWVAAQALEAADHQERFWELHDALVSSVNPWTGQLDRPAIMEVARGLGLDLDRLAADMNRSSTTTKIVRDLHGGFRSGVNGAPTYYVQGIRQDIENADELLERIGHALDGDRAGLWPPSSRHTVDRREAIRLWHDALDSGDITAAAENFHHEIEWHGWNVELPGGGDANGRPAVEELHRRVRARHLRFRAHARDVLENGDQLVVIGELEGGSDAAAWRVPYVQIWEFESGQVRRVATVTDTLAIANGLEALRPQTRA